MVIPDEKSINISNPDTSLPKGFYLVLSTNNQLGICAQVTNYSNTIFQCPSSFACSYLGRRTILDPAKSKCMWSWIRFPSYVHPS